MHEPTLRAQFVKCVAYDMRHLNVILNSKLTLEYERFKSSVQCDQYMKLYLVSYILYMFPMSF
jgi:hypothetical protein